VIRNLPEDRLIERGLSALFRELGPVETTRFLTLRRSARHQLFATRSATR
jgi:hypothetical protein